MQHELNNVLVNAMEEGSQATAYDADYHAPILPCFVEQVLASPSNVSLLALRYRDNGMPSGQDSLIVIQQNGAMGTPQENEETTLQQPSPNRFAAPWPGSYMAWGLCEGCLVLAAGCAPPCIRQTTPPDPTSTV